MNYSNTLPTIVIPAYQPGASLLVLAYEICKLTPARKIIVVDDGSRGASQSIFEQLSRLSQITVLKHERNQGKGAALKTAFRHLLQSPTEGCAGVVTADADGQHLAEDIERISRIFVQDPSALVLGVRAFKAGVPWKSLLGNTLSRFLFRNIAQYDITDTQTGLRAIPKTFLPSLLRLQGDGYEFELEMLLAAVDELKIKELPIQTIYLFQNSHSHFDPVLDSMKVYSVFLRRIWRWTDLRRWKDDPSH